MTVLNLPAAIGLAALVLSLIVNTGALFYWGGSMRQIVKDHDRRLSRLEGSC